MENLESNVQVENSIVCSAEIKSYLNEIARWAKFLSIVGFIGIGLMILVSFFMMVGSSLGSKSFGGAFPTGAIGFVYIFIAALYFFPVNLLFKFAKQMRQGLATNDAISVTTGFKNLKSLFKFMGIFTIVVLSIYALILIIAIPAVLIFSQSF